MFKPVAVARGEPVLPGGESDAAIDVIFVLVFLPTKRGVASTPSGSASQDNGALKRFCAKRSFGLLQGLGVGEQPACEQRKIQLDSLTEKIETRSPAGRLAFRGGGGNHGGGGAAIIDD